MCDSTRIHEKRSRNIAKWVWKREKKIQKN